MSSVYLVSDKEIESLSYLKNDRKIANYLGIDVERVTRVRAVKASPPPPEAEPLPEPIVLPEPIEEVLAEEPILESVFCPSLCPTCGAPVSGRLTVVHIQALVAAYYKIPVREMVSERRKKEFAHPRQVAMYLAYEATPKSLPDIGKRFGGRDHTTVMHAIKQVQKRMLADPELDGDVCALRERISA
jgi:hypothetical protein